MADIASLIACAEKSSKLAIVAGQILYRGSARMRGEIRIDKRSVVHCKTALINTSKEFLRVTRLLFTFILAQPCCLVCQWFPVCGFLSSFGIRCVRRFACPTGNITSVNSLGLTILPFGVRNFCDHSCVTAVRRPRQKICLM